MTVINQDLCQNLHNAVYLLITVYFVHFLKLLNSHENGHICTIMEDLKCMLMI